MDLGIHIEKFAKVGKTERHPKYERLIVIPNISLNTANVIIELIPVKYMKT